MFLIVGLGNPGEKYKANRHNAGFIALDAFTGSAKSWQEKFSGLVLTADEPEQEPAILLKPLTFMNESGRSVGAAQRFHKIDLDRICVVHDELDLPLGVVKFKFGGGFAGHNGLKSIGSHLGSDLFIRLRIGIGRPKLPENGDKFSKSTDRAGDLVHSWVLGNFSKEEQLIFKQSLELTCEGLKLLLSDGLKVAMGVVNAK